MVTRNINQVINSMEYRRGPDLGVVSGHVLHLAFKIVPSSRHHVKMTATSPSPFQTHKSPMHTDGTGRTDITILELHRILKKKVRCHNYVSTIKCIHA